MEVEMGTMYHYAVVLVLSRTPTYLASSLAGACLLFSGSMSTRTLAHRSQRKGIDWDKSAAMIHLGFSHTRHNPGPHSRTVTYDFLCMKLHPVLL